MRFCFFTIFISLPIGANSFADDGADVAFFESKIRPLLVKSCYKCHSEQAKSAEGGLLLDRRSGWMEGGDSGKAVLPTDPEGSLLIQAVRRVGELEMPPENKLADHEVALLVEWVRRGAPGPREDLGETEFSRLGDQDYLFDKAKDHWAFQPIKAADAPTANDSIWNQNAIDRFVYATLRAKDMSPSKQAALRTLARRLTFDLTGLPPSPEAVEAFLVAGASDRDEAIAHLIDELVESSAFGEHFARMWLDVARYADTDSFYRPDTRTPHYFPFAFTYRDYVIAAFNSDKPFDQFIREQLAADLIKPKVAPEDLAALGFLAVGPFANRDSAESLDDWIDLTTRGLMGLTGACARCHDHKYEPIPTADYYSLRGIFASTVRIKPLDEKNQPIVPGYEPSESDLVDYEKKRAAIDAKINSAGDKKQKNNNRSVATKIKETELAELLLFHPGAPARAMTVLDKKRPVSQYIYVRGDAKNRGPVVPRSFLKILDNEQRSFPLDTSGRLALAEKIVSTDNPLTARVYVNRVWGFLMGGYLVDTPSDFGLQGAKPTHPELLDWLADDFVRNGWSTKRLVRMIVGSRTYQQRSDQREDMGEIDPQNHLFWRANRKHLSIEAIRDSLLTIAGQIDRTPRGRAGQLWGEDYTRRRSVYGYINRFNLDPTLRAFDFPTPMQSQPGRGESIVAPQSLFTLNSPFVIEQASAVLQTDKFKNCPDDHARIEQLFSLIYQRPPIAVEVDRFVAFLERQAQFKPSKRTVASWAVVAQAMMMSNEFQYID